jgi:hypothetical protein
VLCHYPGITRVILWITLTQLCHKQSQ